ATLVSLLFEQNKLQRTVDSSIRLQGNEEAAKIAKSVYLLCAGTEARNQKELTHNLGLAQEILNRAGGTALGSETVTWEAINQLTKQSTSITLPKLTVGATWLGQIAAAKDTAPIVDEVSHLTGNFCTIFQRMNDAGDMLRVCTSVLKNDNTRALGTFIPARNTDGTDNAVIQAVLRGDIYHGRAFVVNDWHAAAYAPIWDADRHRVIGMLYVGIGLGTINRELQAAITQMKVGKTGYVYVLGGTGDQRGKYIVSYQGKRDGENIWEEKDANGGTFVQSIIAKGIATRDGTAAFEEYAWQNKGERAPRLKFAAITYYAPWDWIIGAGAYVEDFADVQEGIAHAKNTMLAWVFGIAATVTIFSTLVALVLSAGIARPISRVIEGLNEGSSQIAAAAGQVSGTSQRLAEGASEQAATLEETSSSLEEIASMSQRNAESTGKANELARHARLAAETGVSDMQAMSAAMNDIKTSSDDISKIIKTIDEIAFQTNILALNAAVEAARAGEAGLGFAVVADEVRSLAQRAAQAARETAGKIESAIGKTSQGVQFSQKVGSRLAEIVEKVREVDKLVSEVAAASNEQSQGVQQLNTAVSQMDKVVQSNAANAEESASAAEELNAQAESLRSAVEDLHHLVGGKRTDVAQPEFSVPFADVVVPPAHRKAQQTNGTKLTEAHGFR
ncbi:MAG TPA: methyl-accepting chemotaxis protein, partial [Opitutaceae bacterium]|nr:methyl-accepting chemotaxis protein [Opitutaceae bacterium]